MVQIMFEIYSEYQDSVFYDVFVWFLVNVYNMKYVVVSKMIGFGQEVILIDLVFSEKIIFVFNYVYIIGWEDYNVLVLFYYL